VKSVRVITGRGVPLTRSDVDTDQIIPSDWLKRVSRTGFGEGLFSEWREGSDFVLNQARYDGAAILVAGPNFGTGSSREHAVWALQDYGFEAVVSPRFGDIFRNNSLKMGLVPVTLPHAIVERLQVALDEDPAIELVVDVEARRFAVPALGIDEPFELDDFTQHRLLEGLDDVGITLTHDGEIASYETHRPTWMPTVSAS
jgi:3-isopropylmalate/(R)-2-methylmalate dehydratase small subunit